MGATVWFEEMLGLGKSAKTAYIYARLLDQADVFLASRGVGLADCRAADVAMLAETVKASHASRGQLRAALAAGWEVLGRHDGPARAVRVPPRPRGRCRALSASESAALESAAWDRRDLPGLAVLFGMYAGLRRSEIAGLAWHLFERDAGRLAWLTVQGKGELVAEVPIHPLLAEVCEWWSRPSGWVFPSPKGGHVSPDTVWRWTAQVAAQAGLSKVRTHELRHTALAECNDRSGDLRTVQDIARHSRPEITSIYTRTTRARMMDVVSMIDYGRTGGHHQEGAA